MKKRLKLKPAQIIALSFLLIISLGALLLMLPAARTDRCSAPLETALFTSVSAVCVTGLVVQDTAQYWSAFGQAVILALIQIGGMGVVTVGVLLMVLSGRKIGLRQRWIMQESISAPHVGGIVRMTGFILLLTLSIELLGAVLLSLVFCRDLGLGRGLWYGLFHSVSAFCNAGFDLMGSGGAPFVSLTGYRSSALVSIVVPLLILAGGLGFATWGDIRAHRLSLRRYSLQSKLILSVSLFLVGGSFLFLFLYEFSLPQWAGLSLKERLCAAFFHGVTPRTAGFNTVDLGSMSAGGQLVTLLLMLIGGAPGSTAGGFKMTTFAVLLLCIKAAFKNKENAEAFGRRIPGDTLRNAAAIFILYILLFLGAGIFISCYEGVELMPALFETASAIATVGLSLGLTPGLGTLSHVILMLLMFFGRVGGLTLIYAVAAGDPPDGGRLPQEPVAIG